MTLLSQLRAGLSQLRPLETDGAKLLQLVFDLPTDDLMRDWCKQLGLVPTVHHVYIAGSETSYLSAAHNEDGARITLMGPTRRVES